MTFGEVAASAERAGAALGTAAATLARVDPGRDALGAQLPGRLGELGRDLHRQLTDAVAARTREAAAHGARLADAGQVLRLVAAGYADTDAEARRRHEPPSTSDGGT
jgi:hypothetical protein